MINAGVLPLSCKDLAFTLVHLAPPQFREDLQRCSQKKLFKRMLVNSIRVRTSSSFLSGFQLCESNVGKFLFYFL